MNYFSQPIWFRALNLIERLGPDLPIVRNNTSLEKNIEEAAHERLSYWRSQKPFHKDGFFARRLAADHITAEDLLFLLAEPEGHLQARRPHKPEWLVRLESWGSCTPDSGSMAKGNTASFLMPWGPWISGGREQLRRGIEKIAGEYEGVLFDLSSLEHCLYQALPPRILSASSRVMVLELNVARLQGALQGDTAAERFSSFVERLQRPEAMLTLLQEYPVLGRRVVEIIDNWLFSSLEFVSHLFRDWNALRISFFPDADPGDVTGITGGMGDLHSGGRAVQQVTFSSGAVLIYKPRSLSMDVHFQELLRWLNAKQPGLDFRTLQVLDGGDHGWMEFVTAQGCTSAEQITRFYERQGAMLALLYALNAADFHHENLIAAGEYPVLVDLESLFHPVFDDRDAGEAELIGGRAMDESVLRTGFLPLRFWMVEGSGGIDLSGLGAAAGQILPLHVPAWEQSGTDEMHLVRQQQTLKAAQNQPTLLGNPVAVTEYREALETGFRNLYRLLEQNKIELLEPDGPLASFAQDEVRVILRATLVYSNLLLEASHPDVMRDALDRDCLLDRLWMEVEQFPFLAKTIASETADLERGDIPKFTTRTTCRDLWSGQSECFQNFFADSPMDLVRKRIAGFNKEDLEKQLWFIDASLATLTMERPEKAMYAVQEPATLVPLVELRKSLILKARELGERLQALVLRGGQDVTWVGIAYAPAGWTLESVSLDLYNGLPGIALFLAYLGELTQDARHTELAQKALATAVRQLRRESDSYKTIGFFSGAGGMLYALSHLGKLWRSPDLLAEASRLLDTLPDLIPEDKNFDIIGGTAGCLGALLSLHHCCPSKKTLAAIQQCGEHLVTHAQPMPTGLAWPSSFATRQMLAGFSHGASGISWALMEAAAITRDKSFYRTAMGGIAYERSVFCREHNNWPDFRVREDEKSLSLKDEPIMCAATWCNGAPGLGLSRLAMMSHSREPQLMEDLDTALGITLDKGFGLNHSLCHGDLGNLELLIQARIVLRTDYLDERLTWAANVIYESIQQHGCLTGVPKGVETPGLMVGLAGIGYELLRLAEPYRVPSVLSLGLPLN